jgi:two-component system, NtrC family, response regulator AtoC
VVCRPPSVWNLLHASFPRIEVARRILYLYNWDVMVFNVLIVDDQEEMCRSLQALLERNGLHTIYTTQPERVIDMLSATELDLLVLDVKMPNLDGLTLLQRVRTVAPELPVIMISGVATIEHAVEAMRVGARNFYQKPVPLKELLAEIDSLKTRKLQQKKTSPIGQIITQDPRMIRLIEEIARVAATDVPVMIEGESGTGKELVVNEIHARSDRARQSLVKINCAAIPDTLLESELFGHERGAFTDARDTRVGKFEAAAGGDLFFDEIGELSTVTQAKLLRVLQEGEFERLGSNESRSTDVRIMAATNKNLEASIRDGTFREDLFYRLSVVRLQLPPLRERRIDIPLLAHHFLVNFSTLYNKDVVGFNESVTRIFLNHNWPGNIRELKNTVERAVIFCDDCYISEIDLPQQYEQVSNTLDTRMSTLHDSVNREMILKALQRCNGVKSEAAALLNIHRKTLYNKMKRLGINS